MSACLFDCLSVSVFACLFVFLFLVFARVLSMKKQQLKVHLFSFFVFILLLNKRGGGNGGGGG